MPTHKLTIIQGDYWEGLYLDGVLIGEGHDASPGSEPFTELMSALSVQVEYGSAFRYLEEVGSLPSHLNELPLDTVPG